MSDMICRNISLGFMADIICPSRDELGEQNDVDNGW
jgi:hypothetical protein